MISPTLHAFVDRVIAAGHISSDEVRHLHREILPDGIPSRAVADALLALDRTLTTDELWSDFLTPAVVNYAVWGSRPTGVVNAETANWLLTALTIGEPTPTALRILQEILAEAQDIDPALLLHAWRTTMPQARSISATSLSNPSLYEIRSLSHHSMKAFADLTLTRAVKE
jgi:hypothetical protein